MATLFLAQYQPTPDAAWEFDSASPTSFEDAAQQMFCTMAYEGDYPEFGDPSNWKSPEEARVLTNGTRSYRIVQAGE